MADVIFLHKSLDVISYPSIALSNSEAVQSAYPLTNLQDQYKTTLAKSDSLLKDQAWKFDLGASSQCDSIAIVNHNFTAVTADVGVKLQYADDSGYSSGLTTAVSDLTAADGGITYQTFSSATKRYWRLLFNSSVDLATEPQMAQVYLGKRFDHAYRYRVGRKLGNEFNSFVQRSWDGTDTGYLKDSSERKTWAVTFQILTASYKTNFETFFTSIKGSRRPFLMSMDGGTTWYFVRLGTPAIAYDEISADYYEATLTFIEQVK